MEDNTKTDKDENALTYWNNNKTLYPMLVSIAQHILSIPATNTFVERLFSYGSNTITKCRIRSQTDKVN